MPIARKIIGLLEQALGDSGDAPPRDVEPGKKENFDYAQEEPVGHTRQRGRRAGRHSDEEGPYSGKVGRFVGLFHMLNPQKRHRHALRVAMAWASSLMVVGIIFTILCATGTFPSSRANMEAAGIFVEYLVKYILYIVAGVITVAGVILVYTAVKRGSNPIAGLVLLWASIAVCLATIGLTIFLLTKDAELNVEWWGYLINVLVLVLRITYILSIIAALFAIHEAQHDDAVKQEFILGRY